MIVSLSTSGRFSFFFCSKKQKYDLRKETYTIDYVQITYGWLIINYCKHVCLRMYTAYQQRNTKSVENL